MTIALQKAKNQNPGGFKCTSLHLPAGALAYLVKCGCKQNKRRSKCSCTSQQLDCSEVCPWGAHKDVCENVGHDEPYDLLRRGGRGSITLKTEITTCTCSAASIVLCKHTNQVKTISQIAFY